MFGDVETLALCFIGKTQTNDPVDYAAQAERVICSLAWLHSKLVQLPIEREHIHVALTQEPKRRLID